MPLTKIFVPSGEEIAGALARRELTLVYQPQLIANGLTLAGAEALVRWQHPARGTLAPAAFIDVAEKAGLIDAIGAYVLDQACADAVQWPMPVPVSVNISPSHFVRPGFITEVEDAQTKSGLSPERLEIEVVESVAFENTSRAQERLKQLHRLGVSISMDDFGAGYASLSLLQAMPFDKIKIDKVFVDGLPALRSVAILQATVALIRALGMKITAEGVENTEQERFLRVAGVHYLQGYLFSRPVPCRDLVARMTANPSFRSGSINAA